MGDYYRGDYYRGDPGLLGPIAGLLRKGFGLARRALKFTPAGGAISAVETVGGLIGATRPRPGQFPMIPGTGFGGMQVGPGVMNGRPDRRFFTKAGTPRRIRRDGQPWGVPTLNPANPRALRRAIRRETAFVALARRALKGSGLTISRRSFGRKKAKR